VVERGEALAVFDAPQAPATRRLLQAARAMEFTPESPDA
jgi:ABC-type microcin C transport system duplicated ATPase subunit YejF